MKRNELKYRQHIDKHSFIHYIEKRELEENNTAYLFAIKILKNVIDYESECNNELKASILYQAQDSDNLFNSLIYFLVDREEDGQGDAAGLAYKAFGAVLNYGDKNFATSKDDLKDFLLKIIPNLDESEAAAFICDDLLSDEGLANKTAFWNKYEQ